MYVGLQILHHLNVISTFSYLIWYVQIVYPDDPDREPVLDWIFFRKYSPEDERNSLQHHHDTNMNTVNIELSNDYTGGK